MVWARPPPRRRTGGPCDTARRAPRRIDDDGGVVGTEGVAGYLGAGPGQDPAAELARDVGEGVGRGTGDRTRRPAPPVGRAAVLDVLGENDEVAPDGCLACERHGVGDVGVDVVPRLELDEGDPQRAHAPDGTRVDRPRRHSRQTQFRPRARTSCDPPLEEGSLRAVRRQRQGPLVGSRRLVPATEPPQEVRARGVEEPVLRHRGVGAERVHGGQSSRQPLDLRQRHRPVEVHHRRRRHPPEHLVQAQDLPPVRVGRGRRLVVNSRDRRLELVWPNPPHPQRPLHEHPAFRDPRRIPARPILILEQDHLPARSLPRRPARIGEQHQGQQARRLGLAG